VLIRSYRAAFVLLFTALLVLTTAAVAFNAYRRAAEVSLGLSAGNYSISRGRYIKEL
jgi:hypothetical protein